MPATRRPPAVKVDLLAANRGEYAASRTPKFVRIRRARYLAVTGQGEPGATPFQESIGALYTVAYTVKMARKFAGKDFTVSKLEALYWWNEDATAMPLSQCHWQLLIRMPGFITEREVRTAGAKLIAQGKDPRVGDVELVSLDEGLCVQILHVGPYDSERPSIDEMIRFAVAAGRRIAGRHHEIYLSDPRRVPPARLKTILRQPVA